MRLIDADHLRRWIIARWQEIDPYTDRPFRADEILAQIDRELSIDIVQCKDCKHSEYWYGDKRRCFLWHEIGIDVFEDGYCNYAERDDSQANSYLKV